MSVIRMFRSAMENVDQQMVKLLRTYGEMKNVWRKRVLIKKIKLTGEQKKQIDQLFRSCYGRKVAYHWHRLYMSYSGVFRADYFPEILFSTRLEPLMNSRLSYEQLGDKNMLPLLFGQIADVHVPYTYLSAVNGVIRDCNNSFVLAENLDSLFRDCRCVIKKTIDTSSGRDVQVCCFQNGVELSTGKHWTEILDAFGKDYVVQEKIIQHESLNRIYPNAVNTFRVITYLVNGQVRVCPIALRLGQNGADRDNIHYGGFCIGVKPDGTLRTNAYSEMGEAYSEHPNTKIIFGDTKIEGVERICSAAQRCHYCCPWLGILSWDFTLDQKGIPTLLEVNTTGQSAWFSQMVNGEPLFGADTAYMLNLIKEKRKGANA